MAEYYLNRSDAPFGDSVWEQIDNTVVEAAKSQLSGRRLLHTIGPYGTGLKTLPFRDTPISGTMVEGVTVESSCLIPVVTIHSEFSLSVRDVAAFEQSGTPFDLDGAIQAALACARQEEHVIYNGLQAVNTVGLLNIPGTKSVKLRSWSNVGDAVDDVIAAVTLLDSGGFTGPYALALNPGSYNHLFHRYQYGDMTELDHVRQIVTDNIVKAPAMPGGGVLVDTSGPFANIVLGQDLMTSFIGPSAAHYEFSIIESIALWVRVPGAICILR
jgi:uncharacterized linocin/CFP29 family protein